MTLLYSTGFEQAPGAIAGWVNGPGNGFIGGVDVGPTAGAASGAFSSEYPPGFGFARYEGIAAQVDGEIASSHKAMFSGTDYVSINPLFRCQNGSGGSPFENGYAVCLLSTDGAALKLALFRLNTYQAFGIVGTAQATGLSVVTGDIVRRIDRIVGTTVQSFVWKEGTTQPTTPTATFTINDANAVLTAGFCGVALCKGAATSGVPGIDEYSISTAAAAADTTPPTMTGTMTASGVSASGYTLNWAGTTRADNVAIAGYQHSVDGTNWTDSGNVTSRSFSGKAASTIYPNYVRAYDTASPPNYSTPALFLNVTTAAPSSDVTAPNLSGAITQGTVTSTSSAIGWPAATDNVAVDHYEVSKDGGSIWFNVAVGTLNYTFTGLTPSTAYAQRVRALDAAGNISAVLALPVTTLAPPSSGSVPAITGLKSSIISGGALRAGAFHMQVRDLATGALVNTRVGLTLTAGATGAAFVLAGLVAGTVYEGVLVSDTDNADRGYFRFTAV